MNKVKVLIEGYARKIKGGWLASSTTSLIKCGKENIIVDPGTNRKLLIERLRKENLSPEDITFVFMTHYHPDHNLLVGIFTNAKIIDDEMIYEKDRQTNHKGLIPGTDIKIIKTPGHECFHGSLLVNTEKGSVAIAGDLFWWNDSEDQKTDKNSLLKHKDPFVKDEVAILESRNKILSVADFIIPGHGRMFKVEK